MFNHETAKRAGQSRSLRKTLSCSLNPLRTGEYSQVALMIIPRDVPTVEDFLKKLFGNLEALEEEIQHYPDARSLALLLGARLKVYELVYAHLPQSLAANVCGNDLATKIVSSILSKTKEEIVGEGVEYDDEDNNSDERTPNLGDEAKSSGDNELVLHEGTTEEILT